MQISDFSTTSMATTATLNSCGHSEGIPPFHCFIEFVVRDLLNDRIQGTELARRQDEQRNWASIPAALDGLKPTVLPIEEALAYHGIDYVSFLDWLKERGKDFLHAGDPDLEQYYEDLLLEGPFEALLQTSVIETFFVLFQNRQLLLLFNDMISDRIGRSTHGELPAEYRHLFAKPGMLKRKSPPEWARRAVFFRDRGMCVACHRDVSGLLSVAGKLHYDHIVPLNTGGLNDVSNLQLLCSDCNLKKSGRDSVTSDIYQGWYPMKD